VLKTEKWFIRKAEKSDLPGVLHVYACARKFMAETGNGTQWGDTYPPSALLEEDIEKGRLYVTEEDGDIHGAFVFFIGDEPAYAKIERGAWLSDGTYGVIHRVAGDGCLHGILRGILAFCEEKTSHLRIDTHENNKVMRHLLEKNGFRFCGIIYVEDGTQRIAYEHL